MSTIALPQYPKLPHMRCRDGCADCCGPVTCTEAEGAAVAAYAAERGIKPVRQGITCPWHIGGRCSVYEVRPFVCRLFGHSPRLVCKHGLNVNVPGKREARLMREYASAGDPMAVWLHAAVYDDREMLAILEEYVAGHGGAA